MDSRFTSNPNFPVDSLHQQPQSLGIPHIICGILPATTKFRSTFAVSIEVSKNSKAKNFWGYVVLLLLTTLSKFQFFMTIFAHYATLINEIRFRPLSPSCGIGANITSQLSLPHGFMFCYTLSRSVETWGNSIIFLIKSCKFPTLLNLMRKTGFKRSK